MRKNRPGSSFYPLVTSFASRQKGYVRDELPSGPGAVPPYFHTFCMVPRLISARSVGGPDSKRMLEGSAARAYF